MRVNIALTIALLWSSVAFGQTKKMIEVKSNNSVEETVAKLKTVIEAKGLNLFAVIDHAAAAEKAGLELAPTTLIIFGNPKVGTLLMQADQRMGIELPLKFLITQTADGTIISYKDPESYLETYSLAERTEVIGNVKKAMAGLSAAAAE
jgi:uncharacterized protein (DUF302 family)